MLSRFVKRQGKNLKKHGPKMLGIASLLGYNPLGMLGKATEGLGGGDNMFGKFGNFLFGNPGQEEGTPFMMNQNYLNQAGPMNDPSKGASPGLFQRLGQNMFGLQGDKAAGGGLGLGMNLLGSFGQMNAGYDSDYLRAMNRQLGPLSDAHKNLTQLSKDYMDINSPIHQMQRNAIRGNELTAMSDVMDRAVNQSTGTYGDASQGNINMNALSDAIAKGLGQYSGQTAKHFQTGANLAGSSGTLAAGLGQQRLQNMLLAQQKAQYPWQWMGQTGMGLMNRALTS